MIVPISRVKTGDSDVDEIFGARTSVIDPEDQTQKTETTLPEPNQQTDRCKSKEFKDLQLSATNYLEEEKTEMALEQFEKAYSICPTKELKEIIGLFK